MLDSSRAADPSGRRPRDRSPIFWSAIIFANVILVGGFIQAYVHPTPTPLELLALPLIGFASIVTLIVAHELGHVIAGLLAGMTFHHVRVGPLLLRRSRSGFEFASVSKRLLSGETLCLPRTRASIKARFIACVAGGPIASAIAFFVVYEWYSLLSVANSTFAHGIWFVCFGFAQWAAIFLAVSNSVPVRSNGKSNDARLIVDTVRGTEEMKSALAIMAIVGASICGTRPREWETSPIEHLSHEPKSGHWPGANLVEYYAAIDRDDVHRAGDCIDAIRQWLNADATRTSATFIYEVSFFDCFYRGDPTWAATHLALASKDDGTHEHTRLRAEAALALAGKATPDRVRLLALRAVEGSKRCFDRGFEPLERQWLDGLLAAAGSLDTPQESLNGNDRTRQSVP